MNLGMEIEPDVEIVGHPMRNRQKIALDIGHGFENFSYQIFRLGIDIADETPETDEFNLAFYIDASKICGSYNTTHWSTYPTSSQLNNAFDDCFDDDANGFDI